MKAIFYVMLTLNITYAGWGLFLSPQAAELRMTLFEKSAEKTQRAMPSDRLTLPVQDEPAIDRNISPDVSDKSGSTCWMLGPFENEATARTLQQRLLALEVAPQLKTLTTPVAPDYWVYIEPRMSRPAALRLLRELQDSQIDSFIIGEGELENGISLGFFPDEKAARKVQSARIEDGYAVKIKSVVRNAEEWWVVLPVNEYSKLQSSQWKKLQRELGKWQRRQNYCKLIASAKELE